MALNIADNMELLIEELKKEWDRSGETSLTISIPPTKAKKICTAAALYAAEVHDDNMAHDTGFAECIRKLKECYLSLRLLRKLEKLADSLERKDTRRTGVDLDMEEAELFMRLFGDIIRR